jgi:hypothetical protein
MDEANLNKLKQTLRRAARLCFLSIARGAGARDAAF